MQTNVTGKAALGHPCPRGIGASLHGIDVRNWRPDSGAQAAESDLLMAAEEPAEAAPARPCARGTGSSLNGIS